MKKSKIWIRICVHLLLFITLGVQSSRFDVNPVTDDISRLSILRQNIPKDYKIPVHYVSREEAGMCWVKLNVFYLENSLLDLAHKFGNISSNRKDISIFIQMLQELRLNLGSVEPIMYDFECHFREERWQTARYFDFVKEFLLAAQNREDSDDCEPPTCPTTPYTETTKTYLTAYNFIDNTCYIQDSYLDLQESHDMSGREQVFLSPDSTTTRTKVSECVTGCKPHHEQSSLNEVVERSLLSLLFIPLLALVFLLVWKVRSRRNGEDLEQNPGEVGHFTGTEGTAPPLDAEISEKNKLNVIETV